MDELTVEFRNDQREWVKVATFSGTDDMPLDSVPPFIFNGIPVDDPQFFHEAFQFRFNANISPFGEYENDLWHVDYVMLTKNITSSNQSFNDVAFTNLPTTILKNYTSMPWKHLDAEQDVEKEVWDVFGVGLYNHYPNIAIMGDSKISIKETTTNTAFNQDFKVFESGQNIPEKEPYNFIRTVPSVNFSGIKDVMVGISDAPLRNLEVKYQFDYSDNATTGFNNTVVLNTPFSNYFAHDDGTAERQVVIKSTTGTEQLVSKFHANVEDELRYVEIMFPFVNGDISSQLFNLVVYVDTLDDEPEFQRSLLKPLQPNVSYDTLQGFTTYPLDNFAGELLPLTIPANTDFYVGIQQVSIVNAGIPIGLDLQHPCDCNYFNFNNDSWNPLPESYQGAMMFRPVFGDTAPTSGTKEVAISQNLVTIYPNPSQGKVKLKLSNGDYLDYQITIANSLGQVMKQIRFQPELDLTAFANGVYFVVLTNTHTGENFSQRIILAKP
ncbi:MAG: T9SS type A sorting domain-containing protein [Saprospiraceae bacterium]|nr:T9SS type A sorting domain-containing protein [Saprospiraceae bacterium]